MHLMYTYLVSTSGIGLASLVGYFDDISVISSSQEALVGMSVELQAKKYEFQYPLLSLKSCSYFACDGTAGAAMLECYH